MKRLLVILLMVGSYEVKAQNGSMDEYFESNVVSQVMKLNSSIDSMSKIYFLAKDRKWSDTAIIKKNLDELVFQCFEIPQIFIRESPTSPLCILALHMLAAENGPSRKSPVGVEELEKLFALIDEKIKTSEDGIHFLKSLEVWKKRIKS